MIGLIRRNFRSRSKSCVTTGRFSALGHCLGPTSTCCLPPHGDHQYRTASSRTREQGRRLDNAPASPARGRVSDSAVFEGTHLRPLRHRRQSRYRHRATGLLSRLYQTPRDYSPFATGGPGAPGRLRVSGTPPSGHRSCLTLRARRGSALCWRLVLPDHMRRRSPSEQAQVPGRRSSSGHADPLPTAA
jgi:hypothetical protein